MVTVLLPAPLRRLTGGRGKVPMRAATVAELLDALEAQFPGIKRELTDDRGDVRSFINVFVNGTELRQLQGPRTPLSEADEVSIIPAMAGGWGSGTFDCLPQETLLTTTSLSRNAHSVKGLM